MSDEGKIFDLDPAISVTLGGKLRDLRPSFHAFERIEAHLGKTLGEIRLDFLQQRYGAAMVARILFEGIKAADGHQAPEYGEVGDLVIREGLDEVAPAALSLIMAGLEGLERFVIASRETGDGDDEVDPEDPTRPPGAAGSGGE